MIGRKDLPGGSREWIWDARDFNAGEPMWVKAYQNSLYWTTYYPGQIWTSGMHGESPTLLVDGYGALRNIEFYQGKMYWANNGAGTISRADLDGQNVEVVISGYAGDETGPVDFEIYDGRFYWTTWGSNRVRTCTLDGQDYQEISLAFTSGRAFGIEIQDEVMYIASIPQSGPPATGELLAFAMDGQSYSVLAEDRYINGLEIFQGRIYYNCEEYDQIYSRPLPGGPEVVEYDNNSWRLTVVPEPVTLTLLALGGAMVLSRARRR